MVETTYVFGGVTVPVLSELPVEVLGSWFKDLVQAAKKSIAARGDLQRIGFKRFMRVGVFIGIRRPNIHNAVEICKLFDSKRPIVCRERRQRKPLLSKDVADPGVIELIADRDRFLDGSSPNDYFVPFYMRLGWPE